VTDDDITVQWLLRERDLHFIPNSIRKTLHPRPGEHIMTTGWIDTLEWESFIRVVWVNEKEPDEEEINGNTWWWSRTYDAVKEKMIKSKTGHSDISGGAQNGLA
jgi:hypothetical protein